MDKSYKLWTDDTEWYWARNLRELGQFITEFNGNTYEEMTGEPIEECFSTLDEDYSFQFNAHYPEELPSPMPDPNETIHIDGVWMMIATVKAWREVSSPGFFASTEW